MTDSDIFRVVLMIALMGTVLYCMWRAMKGKLAYIRPISAIAAMEEAIGRATEMGKPVFFATGASDIRAIQTHAAMSVLAHLGRIAARMRTQLVALIPHPNVYPLAEETLREAYTSEGAPELYHPEEQVRFLSQDTNVFAAGVSHLVEKELPGCIIFFGGFDSTALLLAEPGARLGILQIAGDPTMFQMPFFVCTCDHTIMGEEYFAAAAYVSRDPKTRNSLLGQDLIKLIFVVIILVGLFLRHVEVPTLSAWVMQILQVK